MLKLEHFKKHQGILTDKLSFSAGVPQGEILSPILFSMYLIERNSGSCYTPIDTHSA